MAYRRKASRKSYASKGKRRYAKRAAPRTYKRKASKRKTSKRSGGSGAMTITIRHEYAPPQTPLVPARANPPKSRARF